MAMPARVATIACARSARSASDPRRPRRRCSRSQSRQKSRNTPLTDLVVFSTVGIALVGAKGSQEARYRCVVGKMADPRSGGFEERGVDQSRFTDGFDEPFAGDPQRSRHRRWPCCRSASGSRRGRCRACLAMRLTVASGEPVARELLDGSFEDALAGYELAVVRGHALSGCSPFRGCLSHAPKGTWARRCGFPHGGTLAI